MSNAAFKANFSKLIQKVGDKADAVVRRTALDLQKSMVTLSPVDTGRFRNNWQCGVGAVNTDIGSTDDPIGRTVSVLPSWKPGQTIWLSNSMPYARVLEYGRANGSPGSLQAPNGMVRITVQKYSDYLQKAVDEIRGSSSS